MFRECQTCLKNEVPLIDSNQSTWYYSWVTETVSRPGAKGLTYNVKITSKKTIYCTVAELILMANKMIPKYLAHVFRVNHQFKTMDSIKTNLNDNEAYVVIDFSQNYVCKYAEEIQSVHFGAFKRQISLQTGGFWVKNDSGEIKFHSFASISDCLRHDAAAVWALLQPVFQKIRELKPGLQKIHFQSDGPTTQYKNKKNFFLFNYFCKNLQLNSASWNFSAAGHGKSAADGIGGSIKSMCDTAVANGQDVVCAKDMINVVKCQESKIDVFFVTEENMNTIDKVITMELQTIPQTLLAHQISWTNESPDKLSLRYLSCSECISKNCCDHFELGRTAINFEISETSELTSKEEAEIPFSVSESDWVVVIYDKMWYPGRVDEVSGNTLTVSFLSRKRKLFSWPAVPDIQKLFVSQILCKIDPPQHVSSKNTDKNLLRMTAEQVNYVNNAAEKCVIYE